MINIQTILTGPENSETAPYTASHAKSTFNLKVAEHKNAQIHDNGLRILTIYKPNKLIFFRNFYKFESTIPKI